MGDLRELDSSVISLPGRFDVDDIIVGTGRLRFIINRSDSEQNQHCEMQALLCECDCFEGGDKNLHKEELDRAKKCGERSL